MDEADLWLSQHDPAHSETAHHLWEIPVGGLAELEREEIRGGRPVEHCATASQRLCASCFEPFAPRTSQHTRCRPCGLSHRLVYQRDLMRQRRAA